MKPTSTLLAALFCALVFLSFSTTAFALDPHVEAVIRTVEAAKGKVEKTEDGKSLKLVDLAVPGAGLHDYLKDDPYDAAFFEHLGHITTLRRLTLTNTKMLTDAELQMIAALRQLESLELGKVPFPDERLAVLADFAHLKSLRLIPVKEPFTSETQARIKALLPKVELKFQ